MQKEVSVWHELWYNNIIAQTCPWATSASSELCAFSHVCFQMNDIVDASQSSTRELQEQIDIYKEKNRRELTELQKLLRERGQELDKYLLTTKNLQEEVQCISYNGHS